MIGATNERRDERTGGCGRLPGARWRAIRGRRGAVLVLLAVLMPVLIGMLGLVLDLGLLFYSKRHLQNAADAAALAAAVDKLHGKLDSDAIATATTFVHQYNGLASAQVTVNLPPASGPRAGDTRFVEVVTTMTVQTAFIQVLGANRTRTLTSRAVAGYEAVSAGEGVIVLDRNARPGLGTSGKGAFIKVNGHVTVNSEGGGVDENNQPAGKDQTAASVGSGQIFATEMFVVGGVDKPAGFLPYNPGDPPPLHCRQLPRPDPLIALPTPTVGNGVDPANRGRVSVTSNGWSATGGAPGNPNFRAVGGEVLGSGLYTAQAGQVILFPGVYTDISITGGNVIFMPGIYVIKPSGQSDGFKATGGTVLGRGILIYVTGSNYDPMSGTPDKNDGETVPPAADGPIFGTVSINGELQFSPINTKQYTYTAMYTGAPAVSDQFDGMLFFQRRLNNSRVTISGNPVSGSLTGTLYAKWAKFDISGQGNYQAQFVCGSIDVTGQGRVTILAGGSQKGRANQVFLVE